MRMPKIKSECSSDLKIVTVLAEGVDVPISIDEISRLQLQIAGVALHFVGFFASNHAVEITVKITDDKEITEANRDFRNKDTPTNVLSFPAFDWDYRDLSKKDPLYDGYLGDIVVSIDTLKNEAVEQVKPLVEHYLHLFLHGVLHLIGFDHINDEDARIMEELEVKILQLFSIANPYLTTQE